MTGAFLFIWTDNAGQATAGPVLCIKMKCGSTLSPFIARCLNLCGLPGFIRRISRCDRTAPAGSIRQIARHVVTLLAGFPEFRFPQFRWMAKWRLRAKFGMVILKSVRPVGVRNLRCIRAAPFKFPSKHLTGRITQASGLSGYAAVVRAIFCFNEPQHVLIRFRSEFCGADRRD